jgi:Fe-S cluster biosynthesis and repair protein YggX
MDMEAVERRIAQFETMVRPEADPDNDMAWFSLGGAYAQAARHADAARAYRRCVELNPAFTKAFHLAGEALARAGEKGSAIELLSRGYAEAARRGDRMPMRAMEELLVSLGATVPKIEATRSGPAPDGSFICRRSGKPGTKMDRPPFKGPVGEWISAHISRESFDEWIRQGTKVINEMRLDLSRDDDSDKYDRFMREYLGIDDDLYATLTGETSGGE